MAYSSTVTKTKINNVDYVYDITETMGGDTAGTGTDFSIDVTTSGRILRYTCSASAVRSCFSPSRGRNLHYGLYSHHQTPVSHPSLVKSGTSHAMPDLWSCSSSWNARGLGAL